MQAVQPSIAAPAEIQQVASKYKMGAIAREFGPNTYLAGARRRGGYTMLVLALVFCLIGLASMAGGAAGWVFIIIALLPGIIGLVFLSQASNIENNIVKIYLCEKGLIHKDHSQAAQPFRWDQISSVVRSVKITVMYGSRQMPPPVIVKITYTIHRVDGYKFLLDNTISGFDLLHLRVENEVKQIQLPAAIQSYTNGQTVNFGSLSLNQQGISKGNEYLPWQQIEAVKYEITDSQEVVMVKKQGAWLNWAKVTTSTISNLAVFLALADYALKQQGRG